MNEKPMNRNMVLFVTTASSFLNPFMSSSINVALPVIGKAFSMNAILLSWVSTSFLLASAMFLVPFGRIGDIYGRKKIFLSGMAVYTISSFICGISVSSYMLIAFRVLQGVGSTMVFATSVAILLSVFPPELRGKALGINVTGVYSGIMMGPFAGGILTQHFGWSSIFYINILFGVVIIALALYVFRGEWAEAQGEKVDYAGFLVYCIAIPAVMYGISIIPDTSGFWLTGGGLAVFGVFLWIESRVGQPLVNLALFKNRVFTLSNVAALINYSATFAIGFLISLYLQYIKGMSPQAAGIVLVSQPVIMTIFSPLAGSLSDRVSPGILASAGMALTTIGLFLFVFLGTGTPIWYIVAVLMMIGMGFALFSSPNTNAVMGSVEKRYFGLASAIIGTMRLLGMMLSMGIIMIVFTMVIGRVEISPHNYGDFLVSLKTAFLISAIICFAGIFPSMVRGRTSEK